MGVVVGEERREVRINTEPGMLGNGIFKGVSGSLLKVEPFQQGFLGCSSHWLNGQAMGTRAD